MDINLIIKSTGLDKNQAKLYIAALELGEASMTELAKKAGFNRATAYSLVEQLEINGLTSQIQSGKRKIYSAVHPRRLVQIADFRKKGVEDILPELEALHSLPKAKPKVQVFEGLQGIKFLYQELYQSLNKKEEALWFANIKALKENFPESIVEFKKLLRRLKNPKIRQLNYGDEAGKKWSEEMKRWLGKNHQVRTLPTTFEFGYTDNLIFGNKLVIFSFRDKVFVTVIESEDIAKTYRALFEGAWKQGKSS